MLNKAKPYYVKTYFKVSVSFKRVDKSKVQVQYSGVIASKTNNNMLLLYLAHKLIDNVIAIT